jgi:hypothetical protein
MKEDYPIFVKWFETTDWILNAVEKFPKSVRFSISTRISNITLDILEHIIEAIYTKDRRHILKESNLYIEKLRVLFRICHHRNYISHRQYEYVSEMLEENGKMLGGWMKNS